VADYNSTGGAGEAASSAACLPDNRVFALPILDRLIVTTAADRRHGSWQMRHRRWGLWSINLWECAGM